MLRYAVLGSGSSGNAYIFESEDFAFLVDVGFSAKDTLRRCKDLGFDPRNIRYIFLTHGHSDHIKGSAVLAKRLGVPVIDNCSLIPDVTRDFGKLTLRPFSTSHDAPSSLSYHFTFMEKSFTLLTDTGRLDGKMIEFASLSDILFLEANYNEEMLKHGPYPYFLKQRILSERGHLSNTDAIGLLNRMGTDKKQPLVYFCHLSGTNNSPARLEEDLAKGLTWQGRWTICPKSEPVFGLDPD